MVSRPLDVFVIHAFNFCNINSSRHIEDDFLGGDPCTLRSGTVPQRIVSPSVRRFHNTIADEDLIRLIKFGSVSTMIGGFIA